MNEHFGARRGTGRPVEIKGTFHVGMSLELKVDAGAPKKVHWCLIIHYVSIFIFIRYY
jgi:hypothetical protein